MHKKKLKYLSSAFHFHVSKLGEVVATYDPSGDRWLVACNGEMYTRPENRGRQVDSKTRAAEIVHEFLTKIGLE